MLRRHLARVATTAALLAACLVAVDTPAQADYVYCPPNNGPCVIISPGGGGGGNPGGPGGGGGGGGGSSTCIHDQLGEVACYVGGLGWFSRFGPDGACYYNQLTLADDDPLWKGNDPAKGKMYAVSCWGGLSAGWERVNIDYLTSPPPGYGGAPDVLDVVLEAIRLLPLDPPELGTAPAAAGTGAVGLVGLPVWLWVNNPVWGPVTVVADRGLVRVEATGRVTRMEWSMGDSDTVTCTTPGTPYTPANRDNPSPTCGHKYLHPSREAPGGVYTVRGTTFWTVDWTGGGRSGRIPVQRYSEVNLRINELQVVVQ